MVFYYERGEYFCDFVCVCACVCVSLPYGPQSQCTFLLETQPALSAKVNKWSFTEKTNPKHQPTEFMV